MTVTAVARLEGRLRTLALTEPSEAGIAVLMHADAAARLARRADRELADAGVGAAERAELLVAAAELRVLAEVASWAEVRSLAAALALRLRQGRAARRRVRRAWRALGALIASASPRPPPPARRPRG